jgi:ZIP family zinc transporter
VAIALHNLPEELAMAMPATALRSRRFLVGAAVLSALAEPVGAVIGLLAVNARPSLNGYFLAFAAGAMIFVAVHELVPMARRYGKIAWFAAGIVLSVLVHQLLALAIAG